VTEPTTGPPTLWVDVVDDGRWAWGRGDQAVGHLVANDLGGIEPVDALEDLDLVTALLMARGGLSAYDPSPTARPLTPPRPPTSPPPWKRATAGRGKGTGDGPTLAERARHPENGPG